MSRNDIQPDDREPHEGHEMAGGPWRVSPLMTIRQEVLDFAEEMERVMRRNEAEKGKGDSWKTCDLEYLVRKLCEEFLEARASNHDPEEYVDLAIVSMFLNWREKQIRDAYGPPDLKGGD